MNAKSPRDGSFTRRQFSAFLGRGMGLLALPGCGGGGGGGGGTDTTASVSPTSPPPAGPPATTAYAAYSPTSNSGDATIIVMAGPAGRSTFECTLLPLPGQVPAGKTVTSPDVPGLGASVIATWPDGSASLMVAAGTLTLGAGERRTLRIQTSSGSAGAALTPAAIGAVVQSVAVAFTGGYGSAQLQAFDTPERVWWANTGVICARYRVGPGLAGSTALEAVFDIHAYADGRALVELVVENGKLDAAAATLGSSPAAASYQATVTVNGLAVTTVNSANAPEGAHTPFRAWYASAWIGGNPGLRATQAVAELKLHPLLYQCDQSSSVDMAVYAGDAYTPWGPSRQRGSNMGGTGDADSIGPLPMWDAQFLQTGDARAAQAVEANALAVLGFNVSYRDRVTGLVPDQAKLAGKTQTGSTKNWPTTPLSSGDLMAWEVAHHPAAGLMAFVCRPSPTYMEIAQKICVWNATWSAESSNLGGWSGSSTWGNDYTGIFGNAYQMRGRAWCLRSLVHATFLSPDGSAWKSGGKTWLARNATYLAAWTQDSRALLNFFWDAAPNDIVDADNSGSPNQFQTKMWQHHYLTTELHKAANSGLLTGANQTQLAAVADWAAIEAVRWVNEQANGGWRYVPYHTTAGSSPSQISSLPTWGAQMATAYSDSIPSVVGGWFSGDNGAFNSTYASFDANTTAGALYPSYYWAALVTAIERGVPGSQTAWLTVQSGVSNLAAWKSGFANDPRWGPAPRNV